LRGPTGYFFDKNQIHRKILNTYTSAQFSMLVPNMTLVLIQFIVSMIEIYQVIAKKTQNPTLRMVYLGFLKWPAFSERRNYSFVDLKRAIDWYRQINGNNFKYVSIPYL
jgi:hypothetical protein